ncbi:MAG TPA: 3-deoxy-manno-octulosonate cytidylyltransferase [Gemmatimonadaceae bacterium]|nr:3-deoxy-manno-octulosonate cytidylyltransferase [Gemmatimonadaceae bacterium]
MRTLAVIPARLAAVRLPRKPLRLLAGTPLVVRVWSRVAEMEVADRVVVATESEEVATVVRAAGAECVLTSPSHQSGTDRVAEVAARPEYATYDLIMNVQGDEPFIGIDAVRGAVAQVAGGAFQLGTAAVPATHAILQDPSIVKVVIDDAGRALYFSRAPIPWLRDKADEPMREGLIRQHLGLYTYTRAALAAWVARPPHPLELVERLEQLRALAAGETIGVAVVSEVPPAGGIDTEDDLKKAEGILTLHGGRREHGH